MQQLLQFMAAMSAQQPKLQGITVKYDFSVADDGFIRSIKLLNPEIDDKGKPKKLTPDEVAKAKGDCPAERRLAGYKAEFDDLQVGDEIIVTIARQRPPPPPAKVVKTKSPGEKAAKDEEKDKESGKEESDEPPAPKKFNLADWKTVGTLRGVVAVIDGNRLTLDVNVQQWVMPQQNQRNGAANNRPGQPPRQISIDSEKMQATVVLIVRHPQTSLGGANKSR
jgi:hypothetical protein